jgi:hypothetical protein
MPVFTNTIIADHTVGIRCVDPPGARLTSTLWYSNTTNWSGTVNRTNDHFGAPAFVDPGGSDYHIRTESAALDAGVFAGVSTDLDGDARPTNPARPDAPDLGADENAALTVRRPKADTMTFGAACARVTFTGTNSLNYITVTVVYTYPTDQSSNRPLPRYYVITPVGTGSYTASLALCYTQQEFTQSDVDPESSLQLYRLAGGWEAYPSTVDIDNDVVTATQVTSFSEWALGGPGGEPTAVALSSFTAEWDDEEVLVAWETALEIDTVGFNLWRSSSVDGGYERANDVLIPAASPGGVWGGSYAYADADVTPGATYYYKIEELEVGGARNWYGPVSTEGSGPNAVILAEAKTRMWGDLALVLGVVILAMLAHGGGASNGWLSYRKGGGPIKSTACSDVYSHGQLDSLCLFIFYRFCDFCLYFLAFHCFYFRHFPLFYLRNLVLSLDYGGRLLFSFLHAPLLDARPQRRQVLAHDVGRGQLDEKLCADQQYRQIVQLAQDRG